MIAYNAALAGKMPALTVKLQWEIRHPAFFNNDNRQSSMGKTPLSLAGHSARHPFVSYALILACIAVFAIQAARGVDLSEPRIEDLVGWGANVGFYTLLGEPWRLLTSMFLHIGWLHLALNMYMLAIFGPLVERLFGTLRFSLVYLLSGLIGSLTSALYNAYQEQLVVAAGASGALMGIAGAFVGYSLLSGEHDDEQERANTRGPLVQTIGINLALGFINPAVDNACHVGGLLGGALLGAAFALGSHQGNGARRLAATIGITAASLLLVAWGVRQHPEGLEELKKAATAELAGLRDARSKQQADEKASENEKEREQRQAAAIKAEIERDRKNAPPFVSADIAAGTWVDLTEWTEQMLLGEDGKRAYITGSMDNTLKVVSLESKEIVRTIRGGAFPGPSRMCNTCDGMGATGVAVNRDDTRAYVTSMKTDRLSVIDLKRNKIVESIPTGKFPLAVALAEQHGRAFVYNDKSGVAAVDLASRKVVANTSQLCEEPHYTYETGAPIGLWLAADDTEVWIWDVHTATFRVLDAASLHDAPPVILSIDQPRAAHVNASLKTAWVLGRSEVQIVDMAKYEVKEKIALCGAVNPAAMTVSDDGSLMAVAETKSGFVRVSKLRTRQTVGVYPLKGVPTALRFSSDGKYLYATANRETGLSVLELAKPALLKQEQQEWPDYFCPAP